MPRAGKVVRASQNAWDILTKDRSSEESRRAWQVVSIMFWLEIFGLTYFGIRAGQVFFGYNSPVAIIIGICCVAVRVLSVYLVFLSLIAWNFSPEQSDDESNEAGIWIMKTAIAWLNPFALFVIWPIKGIIFFFRRFPAIMLLLGRFVKSVFIAHCRRQTRV